MRIMKMSFFFRNNPQCAERVFAADVERDEQAFRYGDVSVNKPRVDALRPLHEDRTFDVESYPAGTKIPRRRRAGEFRKFTAKMMPTENSRRWACFVEAQPAGDGPANLHGNVDESRQNLLGGVH